MGKSSVSGVSTDQFDERDAREHSAMGLFFNRFFSVGTLLAITVLVYVQNHVGRSWAYGICAGALLITIAVFLSGGTARRRSRCMVARLVHAGVGDDTIYAQMITSSVEQATTMDRRKGWFEIPAALGEASVEGPPAGARREQRGGAAAQRRGEIAACRKIVDDEMRRHAKAIDATRTATAPACRGCCLLCSSRWPRSRRHRSRLRAGLHSRTTTCSSSCSFFFLCLHGEELNGWYTVLAPNRYRMLVSGNDDSFNGILHVQDLFFSRIRKRFVYYLY
jgi:hypothetical protein